MKRLTLLLCVFVALIGAGVAHSAGRPVYIVPESDIVHVSDIENALPAFQAAVTEDFAPLWGQDVHLIVSDAPPAGAWRLTVEDYSDSAGALGYHDFANGQVYGRVFAYSTVVNDNAWQSVLTHELFEMLADPYVDRLSLGKRMWLVEVADPVESDRYNYSRLGADGSAVPISDFVTPAWYRKSSRGPYDFKRHVQHAGQLLPGGYVSYWADGHWHQLFN